MHSPECHAEHSWLSEKLEPGCSGGFDGLGRTSEKKAYGAGPCSINLTDIEHIVLRLQENR